MVEEAGQSFALIAGREGEHPVTLLAQQPDVDPAGGD
jgi:hypothetical protein